MKNIFDILRGRDPVGSSKTSTRLILHRLDPQYHRRFKFHTWKNNLQNRIRYDAPPDPYQTIEIEPKNISNRLKRGPDNPIKQVRNGGLGRIKGGGWDKDLNLSNVYDKHEIKGIIQRFEHGMEWKKTEYYEHLFEKWSGENKFDQNEFKDLESYLQERLNRYECLFKEIKNNGYIGGHSGPRLSPGSNTPIKSGLEVLVVIDRRGRVCLYDGLHRFAIAWVLNIEIPAQVVCRHKQWQELRDNIYNNGLFEENKDELRNHPDLQDLIG